jgi:DNA modification methylase
MTPYYEQDGITIYHGDCRELIPSIPRVDAIITDPPYGIGFAAQPTKWQRLAGKLPEAWDNSPAVFASALVDLSPIVVLWGGNHFTLPSSRGWLSWYKPDAPPSMGHFELAWTNLDRVTRQISCSISQTNGERLGHPTQKPEAVMRWTIMQVAPEAQLILDPFMGSGTTLRAAKDLGKQAIGIEIDERYCEMAAKRLSQQIFDFNPPEEQAVVT